MLGPVTACFVEERSKRHAATARATGCGVLPAPNCFLLLVACSDWRGRRGQLGQVGAQKNFVLLASCLSPHKTRALGGQANTQCLT